jgi:hypothetical protein
MCYEQGLWQAYLDNELNPEEMKKLTDHLQGCPACQKSLKELEEMKNFTDSLFSKYHHELEKFPFDTERGWRSFTEAKPVHSHILNTNILNMNSLSKNSLIKNILSKNMWKEGMFKMSEKINKTFLYKASAVLVVVGLAGSLAFSPVRSAAAEFLKIFRVEKVQVINLSMNELNQIRHGLSKGLEKVDLKEFGKIEVQGNTEAKEVAIGDLEKEAGFAVKKPAYIPEGLAPYKAEIIMPCTLSFDLKVQKVNQLIKSLGGKNLLPSEIDNKKFSVIIPKNTSYTYRGENTQENKWVTVSQGKSPVINVPDNVNINTLKSAVLGLPFLPENLKKQLAGVQDWENALIIPNVEGAGSQVTEVTVNGTKGIFLQEKASPEVEVTFEGNNKANKTAAEDKSNKDGKDQQMTVNGHKGTGSKASPRSRSRATTFPSRLRPSSSWERLKMR